ncbi:MAG: phospholipase [Bacteroidetes bacterium]|nr:MAG: phospholipase [Bacteroidota bacterium]
MKSGLTILFLLIGFGIHAQDFDRYEKKEFYVDGKLLRYRILYPEQFDRSKSYPLIIFLHGAGQWGSDNEKQLLHAGDFFLVDSVRKKFQAIVILPQCPRGQSWSYFQFKWDSAERRILLFFPYQEQPSINESLVKKLSDSLVQARLVDSHQIYLGGLSMGAFGVFDMITRYPGYFAAAFPICGGGNTQMASRIAGKTALWIFHGSADPLVNVNLSRNYYQALKNLGGDVKYTEYPGVRHNSWDNAFAEPQLIPWLFSHRIQ